nr:uncharacterized protein LOC108946461 [Nicotiana tomentosiformis]
MEYKFSGVTQEEDVEVRLDTQVIPERGSFKYLGSVIHTNREIDEYVTYCIGARWIKWKHTSGILYDKKVPRRLKEVKSSGNEDVEVDVWNTRKETIRNEEDKVGVAPVEDKLWKVRLRWYVHVRKKCTDAPVKMCERLHMAGLRKGRGRLKKYWGEMIRHNMALCQVTEDMTLNKRLWMSKIRVEG